MAGLAFLALRGELIAARLPGRVVQGAAVALMIRARTVFGRRSFLPFLF